MQIKIYKDISEIGKEAASLVAAQISNKPNCVLGLATGSSPLPIYNALVALYKNGITDFSKVRTFNLDEYIGIGRSHEQSYYRFMFDNLFSKINIKPENVRIPNPEESCESYDAAIDAAGGIDLQLLGIGNNGHIAFNEPSDVFVYGTHIVDLSESTIEANKRFFNNIDEVPKKAITMGVGSIMKAKEIILVATGKAKSEAVKSMIKDDINPMHSASILQLHPKVTVFLDTQAAALL